MCLESFVTLFLLMSFFPLQDREVFANNVRDVASPDVGRMGIEILSFTIKVNSYPARVNSTAGISSS